MDALHDKPVDQASLLGLTGLLALGGVPHLNNLHPWVMAFFYLALAIRVLMFRDGGRTPGKLVIAAAVVLAIVIVTKTTGYTDGRLFGVALLMMMIGLKLLELKERRDLYVTVFLSYFMLVTLFLFDTGMLVTGYVLLISMGMTAILVKANQVQSAALPWPALRTSVRMILASIPVMLLLFVFFPRLEGPLWRLSLGKGAGLTGMSDNISMGSISELSQSEELAFRVEFLQGRVPAAQDRYWRGMVLRYTDGKHWLRGRAQQGNTPVVTHLDEPLRYRVTMEASGQPWLFPLDRLAQPVRGYLLSSDLELSTANGIEHRISFEASASLDYWLDQVDPAQLHQALQLPDNITLRMRDLVGEWLMLGDDERVVQAALDHFHQQPFVYTLRPPLVEANPVDQFMFDTQRGFCEHYATSFATLMRLAGIPANVVIGYQGGELNPVGQYLMVHQSDAHAWAEVWLKGRGWVRVDPTAAVAPERIELGIDLEQSSAGEVFFRGAELGMLRDFFRQATWLRDRLELNWHQWVLGYNKSKQDNLFDQFGLGKLDAVQKNLLAVLAAFIGIGLAMLLSRRQRQQMSPVLAAYRRYQAKLRKAGLEVPAHLGPEDLARSAVRRFPKAAADIRAITGLYQGLRYGRGESKDLAASLIARVRRLKLG